MTGSHGRGEQFCSIFVLSMFSPLAGLVHSSVYLNLPSRNK